MLPELLPLPATNCICLVGLTAILQQHFYFGKGVHPETGPQYRMNLFYLIEVLMGKFD